MATDSVSLSADPYNYPSLNRKDCMFLSTISNKDEITKSLKGITTNRNLSSNLTNLDIPGSSPKIFGPLRNKEDFTNRNDDIDRSSPKLLHVRLNKDEYNLTNKDIKFSAPQCNKFITSRAPFNPLEPKYKLCPVEPIDPLVPKFIRDSIDVSDIEFTSPKKRFVITKKGDSYHLGAIDGSSPRKPYIRKTRFDNINYSDVTHDVFQTKRNINPLDPVYNVKYRDGTKEEHGPIEGAKPVVLNLTKHIDPLGLKNADIDGTQVGSKNRINQYKSSNTNLTNLDIINSGPGSLKRGITSERHINPLMPVYQMPGGKEVNSVNNPYGQTLHKKKKVEKIKIPEEHLKAIANLKSPTEFKPEINELDKLDVNRSIDINGLISQNRENIDGGSRKGNGTPMDHGRIETDNKGMWGDKYNRPDPYFGNLHDKYLISNDIVEAMALKESNTKHRKQKVEALAKQTNANHESDPSQANKEKLRSSMMKSGGGINAHPMKQSMAQKLDSFIGNYQ